MSLLRIRRNLIQNIYEAFYDKSSSKQYFILDNLCENCFYRLRSFARSFDFSLVILHSVGVSEIDVAVGVEVVNVHPRFVGLVLLLWRLDDQDVTDLNNNFETLNLIFKADVKWLAFWFERFRIRLSTNTKKIKN